MYSAGRRFESVLGLFFNFNRKAMKNRNSREALEKDILFLEVMLENAQHLHNIGCDIETSQYLVAQICDWLAELRTLNKANT